MWLIDSSVWIDYFNGTQTPQTNRLDSALGVRPLAVGDIILTEVLQGFRHRKDFELAKSALLTLDVFQLGGVDLAIKSAENFRTLRRRGITVRKTIDCLIATFAIENNFPLLHTDRDFDPFEKYLGLTVVH